MSDYKCQHSGCDKDAVFGINYSKFEIAYACQSHLTHVIGAYCGVYCYRLEDEQAEEAVSERIDD